MRIGYLELRRLLFRYWAKPAFGPPQEPIQGNRVSARDYGAPATACQCARPILAEATVKSSTHKVSRCIAGAARGLHTSAAGHVSWPPGLPSTAFTFLFAAFPTLSPRPSERQRAREIGRASCRERVCQYV